MIAFFVDARSAERLARLATNVAFALILPFLLASCGKGAATEDHAGEGDQHADAQKDEHADGEEGLTLTAEETERAGVKVEAIESEVIGETIQVTATIQPDQNRMARIAPRIEGRITSAPANLGDRVSPGQIVATLDSVAVAEAHASLTQAQAELRIAEADLKRAKSLSAEEIISRKEYLRAQTDRSKAAALVQNAVDRLRLLGGDPEAKGSDVSAFAVTAPFAGIVIEKQVTLGELVSPSESMFTVADLSTVWIQADVPETALGKIREGVSAKVSVPAYPGQNFGGLVSYIGATLDKDTRTTAARIEVPNSDGRLKPGMFATATIEAAGDKREVIALPDAAIVLLEGVPSVFVYEQGAYEARQVEPGDRIGGRTLLKSGVKAGDQVVVSGTYALKARKLKSQLGHGH